MAKQLQQAIDKEFFTKMMVGNSLEIGAEHYSTQDGKGMNYNGVVNISGA